MLQNDWIPTEMFRYFLTVFRENAYSENSNISKNIRGNFIGFYDFCEAYLEVKNMNREGKGLSEDKVLDRGFSIGISIKKNIENKDYVEY